MRLFFLIIGFLLIFSALFEFFYKESLILLIKEAKNIKHLRLAYNFKISFFKKDTLQWVIKGKKLNASDKSFISIQDLYAENFQELLKVKAKKAFYVPTKHLIELVKNVVIEKLNDSGKILETLITDKAYIDLYRNKVYGPNKVVIKRGKIILSGRGFLYDTKTGKFLILKNGTTIIGVSN